MFIRHCVCCSRRLAHGRGEYTSIEWDTLAVFGPDFEGSFSRSIWGPDAPTVRTGSSYCAPRSLSKQEKRGFASILLRDVSETFRQAPVTRDPPVRGSDMFGSLGRSVDRTCWSSCYRSTWGPRQIRLCWRSSGCAQGSVGSPSSIQAVVPPIKLFTFE